MDKPNKEVLVDLLMEIEHVTEASYGPVPADIVVDPADNTLAFTVRQIIPGDGTWAGRDNTAQIYVPRYLYDFSINNDAIVVQMRNVLAEIEVNGTPTPTFDAEPIIPPIPPDETVG